MANNVVKVNGIAIANIAKLNGITDANLAKLNGEEFTGTLPDAHTLISTHDIAVLGASASIDITSGIDNTYDAYEFRFMNMHPVDDGKPLLFQVNAYDTSADPPQLTGFNEKITSTIFSVYNNEADSAAAITYQTSVDQAEGVAYQYLSDSIGNDNDESASGILTLYAPSSPTYVKHFTSMLNGYYHGDFSIQEFGAGYINTTNAINQISFKFLSGNIDAGEIKMYGIAKA